MPRKEKVPIYRPCSVKELPPDLVGQAVALAREINPANSPPEFGLALAAMPMPDFLAVYTTRYWGARGVDLSVSFLENTPTAVRDRILAHMNAWGEFAAVKFFWTQGTGQVRISRGRGGYWSYLGTDILTVPQSEPTMNLEGFSANTSEAEYRRIVRHEVGHTLGMPHEHLRREIVEKLDVQKTLAYFRRTQGWSEATIRSNVLTPLEESRIMASEITDEVSIMAYGLPASITKDGRPIPGGNDFSRVDREFVAKLYPKAKPPEPPKPAVPSLVLKVDLPAGTYSLVRAQDT